MRSLIIYHGSCMDGFTAAHLVEYAMRCVAYAMRCTDPDRQAYEPPDFHAAVWDGGEGQQAPVALAAAYDVIYVVDFSYPAAELIAMAEVARATGESAVRVILLDHHQSAEAMLRGLAHPGVKITFDMERSGARLVWDELVVPHVPMGDAEPPWLVRYVEDRDLWRQELPDTEAVTAYIASQPFTAEAWDAMLHDTSLAEAIERGQAVRRYIERYIGLMLETNQRVVAYRDLAGAVHQIPVLNIPFPNGSEVLNVAAKGRHFAVGWYQHRLGHYVYMLRSDRAGSDTDVSRIAQAHGGGGHRNAAGFTAPNRVW